MKGKTMKKNLFALIVAIFAALFIAAPSFADGLFHCPSPFQPSSSFEGGGIFETGSFFNKDNFGTYANGIGNYMFEGVSGRGSGSTGGNTNTNVSFSAGFSNLDLDISSGGEIWSNSSVRLPKIRPPRP
ncbi:hypothetical protein KAI52_03450 [Candidatus Parcubacteria bacterium]|nr:hypothetical protein [Candidatus Parcubacteria bacterium]